MPNIAENRASMGPDYRHCPDRRVWECDSCGCLNTWNWKDQERLTERTGRPWVQDAPAFTRRNVIGIAHGSCFDNVCGVCGANHVRADSPILAD